MLHPIKLLATALVLSLGFTLAPVAGSGGPVASAELYRDAYVVRLATHNIKCEHCGGDFRWRARRSAQMVRNTDSRVVSFQEVGATQLRVLKNKLPGYWFWPQRRFGGKDSQLQIAWKRRSYALVEKGKFRVPVRGYRRVVPWVRLRDRNTGRRFWVMAIHNSPNGREGERDRATAIQIRKIKAMWWKWGDRQEPVFVLGDANERVEFCRKAKNNTPLWAMNAQPGNACPVPPGGPDWMLGNQRGVVYRGFRMLRGFESMHDFMKVRARVRPSSIRYWRWMARH